MDTIWMDEGDVSKVNLFFMICVCFTRLVVDTIYVETMSRTRVAVIQCTLEGKIPL